MNKNTFSDSSIRCSASRVVENIKEINNRFSNNRFRYIFTDSCLSLGFISDFVKLVEKEDGIKNNFVSYMRCEDWLTFDVLKGMKKAGFDFLKFGPESFHPRLIKILNKGFQEEQIFEIFDNCKKLDIKIILNLMVGLPTQTREDLLDDLNKILHIVKKYNNIYNIWITPMRVEKKSSLYKNPEKHLIKIHDSMDLFAESIPWSQVNVDALSQEEAIKITKEFCEKYLLQFKKVNFIY